MFVYHTISCKRGIVNMGHKLDKLKNLINEHQFITGVLASIVASAIISSPSLISTIYSIPNRINNVEKNIKTLTKQNHNFNSSFEKYKTELDDLEIEENFDNINTYFKDIDEKFEKANDNFEKIETRIRDIEKDVFNYIVLQASKQTALELNSINSTIVKENFTIEKNNVPFLASSVVGKDFETNKNYRAENLRNKKLILTYIGDDGEDVIFCGQFNSKQHWDGKCSINVYKKDKLILITDAEYENGKILKYQQFINNGQTFIVSDRKNNDSFNTGETWSYKYDDKYIRKKINFSDISLKDILTVSELKMKIKTTPLTYYSGRTSYGSYNDTTGNAHYLKYSENGNIETLYVGNFENGNFDDATGNAQEIVYDTFNNVNRYFYYKGVFVNGNRQEKVDVNNYVTQKQIDKILEGIEFSCELKWHKTN